MLTVEQIARLLGVPLDRVQMYWPLIATCLGSLCEMSVETQIGALATIAVETAARFQPLREFGSDALHEHVYGHRADLGNTEDGDGAKYAGRGFIQITGRANYERYGKQLGTDLVAEPDKALEANAAASIFAMYFVEKGCDLAAKKQDWTRLRRIVNGGDNGLQGFLLLVKLLGQAAGRQDIVANAKLHMTYAAVREEQRKAEAANV